MTNQSPKISVIVPVYNVEKYLTRCIDSILSQTFTDFELLLIDDGSTDNSGKICDDYSKNDVRIRVFHKENGGVSSARNLGLDNAKGEWITFCDSDDWIKIDFLAEFAKLASKGGDLLSQGFHSFMWKNIKDEDIFEDDNVYQNDSILPFLLKLYESTQLGYIWCKAFKKQIIDKHKIRFNTKYNWMEDLVFIMQYCRFIEIINNSSKCYYQYYFTAPGKNFGEQVLFDVNYDIYTSLLYLDKKNKFFPIIKDLFLEPFFLSIIFDNINNQKLRGNIDFFLNEFLNVFLSYKGVNKKMRLMKYFLISKNEKYIYWLFKLFRFVFKK